MLLIGTALLQGCSLLQSGEYRRASLYHRLTYSSEQCLFHRLAYCAHLGNEDDISEICLQGKETGPAYFQLLKAIVWSPGPPRWKFEVAMGRRNTPWSLMASNDYDAANPNNSDRGKIDEGFLADFPGWREHLKCYCDHSWAAAVIWKSGEWDEGALGKLSIRSRGKTTAVFVKFTKGTWMIDRIEVSEKG